MWSICCFYFETVIVNFFIIAWCYFFKYTFNVKSVYFFKYKFYVLLDNVLGFDICVFALVLPIEHWSQTGNPWVIKQAKTSKSFNKTIPLWTTSPNRTHCPNIPVLGFGRRVIPGPIVQSQLIDIQRLPNILVMTVLWSLDDMFKLIVSFVPLWMIPAFMTVLLPSSMFLKRRVKTVI